MSIATVLLFCFVAPVVAQQHKDSAEEQTVVLKESSVTAIAAALKRYKQQKAASKKTAIAMQETNNVLEEDVEILREIEALERKIAAVEEQKYTNTVRESSTEENTLVATEIVNQDTQAYEALAQRVAQLENQKTVRDTVYVVAQPALSDVAAKDKPVVADNRIAEIDQRTAELRAAQQNEMALLQQEIANLQKDQKRTDDAVSKEEKEVNKELRDLRKAVAEKQKRQRREKNTTTIVMPTQVSTSSKDTIVVTSKSQEKQVSHLQHTLDSLRTMVVASEQKQEERYISERAAMEAELKALEKQLATKNAVVKTTNSELDRFKNVKEKLFFENNSKSLSANGVKTVAQFVSDMEANKDLDIMIQGFASSKGSVKANETISLLRTEAVKKELMLQGIPPDRIVTQYHGIDYAAASEAQARRVELSYLIAR